MGNIMDKKEISILGLFGEDKLRELQERVSEVTNFSFEIIDYRGEQVVSPIVKNDFCKFRSGSQSCCSQCKMTTAYAAAKAAIQNKPNIFVCDAGLCHIAIPIIVSNQYIGAFIVGKVYCPEINREEKMELDSSLEMAILNNELSVVTKNNVYSAKSLIEFIVGEMISKEESMLEMNSLRRKETHLKDMRAKNEKLSEKLELARFTNLKAQVLPQMQIGMLVLLSSSAVLEEASKTEELAVTAAEIIRYYLECPDDDIYLWQEVVQIDNYLRIMKEQYSTTFNYHIQCDNASKKQLIPALGLFPFVQYILDFGLASICFKGTLYIDAVMKEDKCVVTMQINYTGNQKVSIKPQQFQSFNRAAVAVEQMNNAKSRFDYSYSDKCNTIIQEGFIRIELPRMFEKGEISND